MTISLAYSSTSRNELILRFHKEMKYAFSLYLIQKSCTYTSNAFPSLESVLVESSSSTSTFANTVVVFKHCEYCQGSEVIWKAVCITFSKSFFSHKHTMRSGRSCPAPPDDEPLVKFISQATHHNEGHTLFCMTHSKENSILDPIVGIGLLHLSSENWGTYSRSGAPRIRSSHCVSLSLDSSEMTANLR